jgi:ubiquinone/menaquinone biosynthesis C-methylase UbiE
MDIIFCSSLIEHVADQDFLLSEISRVLKNHGICYLSFPPFYSPVGGHQFKPFHLLGERWSIYLARVFKRWDASDYQNSYGNFGLYPTTIQKVRQMTEEYQLKVIATDTKFSPINFAKIPLLNEFLTWHVEFILQKNDPDYTKNVQ